MSGMWEGVFSRLDRVSRERALTDEESLMLERAIKIIDNRSLIKKSDREIWTGEEAAEAADLFRQGLSYSQIGAIMGRPRSSVGSKLQRMGLYQRAAA